VLKVKSNFWFAGMRLFDLEEGRFAVNGRMLSTVVWRVDVDCCQWSWYTRHGDGCSGNR